MFPDLHFALLLLGKLFERLVKEDLWKEYLLVNSMLRKDVKKGD